MNHPSLAKAQAVVFDADGTLFNSFELIVSAYRHVAETHNLWAPSAEEVRQQLGKSLPDIFQHFYPGHDIQQLLSTNNAFVAANSMRSEAYAGLKELLEALHSQGFQLAILTSGGSKIYGVLDHHEVSGYFTSIVHHERIEKPKPHPEGFILATQECGVKPSQAIIVGDSVQDILTGKNAGALASIAITHGYGTLEDIVNAKPDYTVGSLAELAELLTSP